MSMYKSEITVSRKWDNPHIICTVTNNEISLTMDLDDFKKALVAEIGSVAMIFKSETFAAKVDVAFQNVIEGIKAESTKVM